MEVKDFISGSHRDDHFHSPAQGPSVDLIEFLACDRVFFRVEVIKIRKAIAKRVAQLSIGFRKARENLGRDHHVLAEINGSYPQPQDFRAMRLDHLVWIDDVAE